MAGRDVGWHVDGREGKGEEEGKGANEGRR